MGAVFLKIVNMSITASWLILAVILVRFLLKRAPKWISCVLWALVAVRLICPFSLESALSMIPSRETIPADIALQHSPAIHSGIAVVNETINPVLSASFAPAPGNSANPLQIMIPAAATVWLAGLVIMLAYALGSYVKLKKTVSVCAPVGKRVFACDEVKTPFILGVFRPVIYVPSSMDGETLACVIRHENAHLQRRDHWWKPLGFLLLAVHWFNPLCWAAYILLCRDIEMACDEKVIRDMDREDMAAYSQALLDCSLPRKRIAACPLAFGEVGVKERVKGVLNYKKPAFWIIAAAVLVCVLLAVFLMTNPRDGFEIDREEVEKVSYFNQFIGDDCRGELSSVQIDEMIDRFSAVSRCRRSNRYAGQTPGYQLCVFLKDGTYIYANGYHAADDMVELISKGKRYSVSDPEFAEYLRNVCSRGDSSPAKEGNMIEQPFGRYYTIQEIRYEGKRDGGHTGIPLPEYCITGKGELLILEDLNSDSWLNAGTFTETELSKDTFDRYFDPDGKTTAADLRRNNTKAWQLIVSDLPDSAFYDLLLQEDGEICLTRGYYDAGEKNDPDSDDTRISYVFVLKENDTRSEPEIDMESLRAKYPEYFDLNTTKGLEVYVWQMAAGSYSCGLKPGTNRDKTLEELMNLKGTSIAEMRAILSTYDMDVKDIFIIPWQNPISSYMSEYWISLNDEDPASAEKRRQEYVDRIRHMLFGVAQHGGFYLTIGSEGVKSIEISAPYTSGGCQNADGSVYRKGETIWLEPLEEYADLRGVTFTALDEAGAVVWTASVPDTDDNRGFTRLTQDGWTVTNLNGSAAKQILTLDDVRRLAQKGNDLSWKDFEAFQSTEIGSGLYILHYDVDDVFVVIIGGGSMNREPMYIRLRNRDINAWIDIRTDDVNAFLAEYTKDGASD